MKDKNSRKNFFFFSAGAGVLILLGAVVFLILPLLKAQGAQPAGEASSAAPKETVVSYQGKDVTFVQKSEASTGLAFTLGKKPFATDQLAKIKNTLGSDHIFITDEKLHYYGPRDFLGEGVPRTEEAAISQAKKYLDTLGLLPKDNYWIRVSQLTQSEMDLVYGTSSNIQRFFWTVLFYPTYHGVPVVTEQSLIEVSISAYGIESLSYIWPNIIPVDQTEDHTMLTADQAIQKYLETNGFKEVFKAYQTLPEIHFQQVYIYKEEKSVSAWIFGENELFYNPVFLDAYTGEKFLK
jgi:hypothetical protein